MTQVDLSTLAEGQTVIVKWRGKPLFIRHRTAEEIESANDVNMAGECCARDWSYVLLTVVQSCVTPRLTLHAPRTLST